MEPSPIYNEHMITKKKPSTMYLTEKGRKLLARL